tara:strand:- start:6446 stop:6664 length:219 start_codon:yes stop_codon:yes gene_type:complete
LALAEAHPILNLALVEGVKNVLALEGEVGLELEHNGRAFQSAEFPDGFNVRYDATVSSSNVLGAKSLAAKYL